MMDNAAPTAETVMEMVRKHARKLIGSSSPPVAAGVAHAPAGIEMKAWSEVGNPTGMLSREAAAAIIADPARLCEMARKPGEFARIPPGMLTQDNLMMEDPEYKVDASLHQFYPLRLIHALAQSGGIGNVKDIVTKDILNVEGGYRDTTALHGCAVSGTIGDIPWRLTSNDRRRTDRFGSTVLHYAAQGGYLQESGCDFSECEHLMRDNGGDTVVMSGAWNRKTMSMLAQKGILTQEIVGMEDKDGNNLLARAQPPSSGMFAAQGFRGGVDLIPPMPEALWAKSNIHGVSADDNLAKLRKITDPIIMSVIDSARRAAVPQVSEGMSMR